MDNKVSGTFNQFLSVYQSLEKGKLNDTRAKLYKKLIPPYYNNPNTVAKYTKYIFPECHFTGHNLWILKPIGLNRGRGIHIFRNLEFLKKIIIENMREGSLSRKSNLLSGGFIIQKYIESPLLVNKRKFDIRMWVLITGEMNVY